MAYGKLIKVSLVLGLALYITYILTTIALGLVLPLLPLAFLGVFRSLVEIILTILAMGLIGAVVLRFVV